MAIPFVVVFHPAGSEPKRSAAGQSATGIVNAAGAASGTAETVVSAAAAVLTWPQLCTGSDPVARKGVSVKTATESGVGAWDELPAVLIDPVKDGADPEALFTAVLAALRTLEAVDGAVDSTERRCRAVIATTKPVTDTLKLVDSDGTVTGTAERDDHRFVATPIVCRFAALREISEEDGESLPSPIAVLTALAAHGATVVGT
jgi:hypothetical protein